MKLKTLLWCFVCTVFSTLQAQDLLITELTDPQNSSDAGRYVEIYNPSTNDVDLSTGFALQRWTNGNADPQSAVALTGTILAGGYYVVCNDAAKFLATYGMEASQDIGTGGAADSNGDDNVALIGPDGSVVDMFGVPGEDGSGTGHEFEDGRAERKCGTLESPTWIEADWNVDNDSGGGDGNQYAPEGFDPFSWANDGTSCTGDVVVNDPCAGVSCEDGFECVGGDCLPVPVFGCTDASANNYNADATSDDGSCTYDVSGCTDPSASNYNADATSDDGSCEFISLADAAPLFFSEYAEGSSNNKYLEIFNPTSEPVDLSNYAYPSVSNAPTTMGEHEYWNTFDEGATIAPGDVYVVAHPSSDPMILEQADETHSYLSNGDDGYALAFGTEESHVLIDMIGDFMGDPGSGWSVAGVSNATKDHTLLRKMSVTSGNTDWTLSAGTSVDDSEWVVLDIDTWVYLGSHAELQASILGCTDALANNYNPDATSDDGSCTYDVSGCTDPSASNYNADATSDDGSCEFVQAADAAPLFFSEYAEGSSNNKYLEIFNPTSETVDLSNYAYPSVSNAPTTPGVHEYWNTFDSAATIAPGDVYVIAHPSSDPIILEQADETHAYLSNGDDGYALAFGSEESHVLIDMIGDFMGDPGSGWEVAGVSNATKDHTLLRKFSVTSGNSDWTLSAGTSPDDSEWIVLDQDTWDYLGSHTELQISILGCTDPEAFNYNNQATEDDGSCIATVLGCTWESADNYNPDANTNDGSCFTTYLGCTDALALNYDSLANTENNSCIYNYDDLTNALSLQGVLDFGLSGSDGKALHLVVLSDVLI